MVPVGAGAARPALEKASHGLTNLRLTLMFHHSQVRQSSRCPSLGQPPNPTPCALRPTSRAPRHVLAQTPQPLRNLEEKAEKQPRGSAFLQQHCSSSLSRLDPWALRGTAPSQRDAGGRLFSPGNALMHGAKAVAEGHGCLAGLNPCLHTPCTGLAARLPSFPLPFPSRRCTLPGWLTAAPGTVSGLGIPKRVLRGAGGGMRPQAGDVQPWAS